MSLFVHIFSASVVSARIDLSGLVESILPKVRVSPPLGPSTEHTVEGCECISDCGATPDDSYACDWCKVPDHCGKSSVFSGQWDYCLYDEQKSYEAQDHKAKMAQIWAEMTAPDVIDKSGPLKDPLSVVTQMVTESMRTTMDMHRDVLPIGRTKVIHAQGVHCQFELNVAAGSGYSGVFSPGVKEGIIRMGSATGVTDIAGIFPGLGIKFLRDGVTSANFVALRSTGPGGSKEFFAKDLTNHGAPPTALQALMKFQQASSCISMVGLSDVCVYDQDGTKASNVVFPFQIFFEPTGDFRTSDDPNKTDEQLLHELSTIPLGTHLFDVFTKSTPTAAKVQLGELRTTTKCVQSIFGDTRLAFKHQRMEADFRLRPEWMPEVHLKACEPKADPVSKWQCPFH